MIYELLSCTCSGRAENLCDQLHRKLLTATRTAMVIQALSCDSIVLGVRAQRYGEIYKNGEHIGWHPDDQLGL